MLLFSNCPQGRHPGKLRPPCSILQNQGKTAGLPPMAPLVHLFTQTYPACLTYELTEQFM